MAARNPPRRRTADPASSLALRLEGYANGLSLEEKRIHEAMLVMAMDPLDRQSRRLTPILTADEADRLSALRSDE